jgi:hypothetical protein
VQSYKFPSETLRLPLFQDGRPAGASLAGRRFAVTFSRSFSLIIWPAQSVAADTVLPVIAKLSSSRAHHLVSNSEPLNILSAFAGPVPLL